MNMIMIKLIDLIILTNENTSNNKFNGKIALWIALGCFLVPVLSLSLVVIIKKIIKLIITMRGKKPKSKSNLSKNAFLSLFGTDNVVSVDVVMTRVIVEVKDLELVQLEELKKLNIGVLITGNVIKCSSEEYAELLK